MTGSSYIHGAQRVRVTLDGEEVIAFVETIPMPGNDFDFEVQEIGKRKDGSSRYIGTDERIWIRKQLLSRIKPVRTIRQPAMCFS